MESIHAYALFPEVANGPFETLLGRVHEVGAACDRSDGQVGEGLTPFDGVDKAAMCTPEQYDRLGTVVNDDRLIIDNGVICERAAIIPLESFRHLLCRLVAGDFARRADVGVTSTLSLSRESVDLDSIVSLSIGMPIYVGLTPS